MGVYKGDTLKIWADNRPTQRGGANVYGFDSFQGLQERWSHIDESVGSWNAEGKVPQVDRAEIVVGEIQKTLPEFLRNHHEGFSFVHIDVDTYPTTKFILSQLKGKLLNGSLILFDELLGYPGWEFGEYRALREVLDPHEFSFCGFGNMAALIQINNDVTLREA